MSEQSLWKCLQLTYLNIVQCSENITTYIGVHLHTSFSQKMAVLFAVYKTHLRATRSLWSSKNIKFSFLQSLRSNRGVRLQVLIKLRIFSTFSWAFNILPCRSSTSIRICCICDHTSEAQHIDTTLSMGHEITTITNNYHHVFKNRFILLKWIHNTSEASNSKMSINKIKVKVTEKKRDMQRRNCNNDSQEITLIKWNYICTLSDTTIYFIVTLLLATSFSLKRPSSGHYLQKT